LFKGMEPCQSNSYWELIERSFAGFMHRSVPNIGQTSEVGEINGGDLQKSGNT